jgi:hypothetical protein
MSLESDLYTALSTHGGLSALVGTRIYPNRLPDNPTLPAVVYQRITTNHNLASGNVPLIRARMQLDCYDDSYLSVVAVAVQVHAALDMASPTGLAAAVPENDDDSYDPEALLHRRRLDVFVWKNQ